MNQQHKQPTLPHRRCRRQDAIERARKLHKSFGSVGAYTDSRGNAAVRQEVADFIQQRDGYPSNPDHIFLTGERAGLRHSVGWRLCINSGAVDVHGCWTSTKNRRGFWARWVSANTVPPAVCCASCAHSVDCSTPAAPQTAPAWRCACC